MTNLGYRPARLLDLRRLGKHAAPERNAEVLRWRGVKDNQLTKTEKNRTLVRRETGKE